MMQAMYVFQQFTICIAPYVSLRDICLLRKLLVFRWGGGLTSGKVMWMQKRRNALFQRNCKSSECTSAAVERGYQKFGLFRFGWQLLLGCHQQVELLEPFLLVPSGCCPWKDQ